MREKGFDLYRDLFFSVKSYGVFDYIKMSLPDLEEEELIEVIDSCDDCLKEEKYLNTFQSNNLVHFLKMQPFSDNVWNKLMDSKLMSLSVMRYYLESIKFNPRNQSSKGYFKGRLIKAGYSFVGEEGVECYSFKKSTEYTSRSVVRVFPLRSCRQEDEVAKGEKIVKVRFSIKSLRYTSMFFDDSLSIGFLGGHDFLEKTEVSNIWRSH